MENKVKSKKQLISSLWKNVGRGKYIKINKIDGSMPTYKEFEKMMMSS